MKRAIVLSGGGSRGAYQIGVWQALQELNIDYQIVTGSSIGALNGALMAQQDYGAALDIWENLQPHSVVAEEIEIPEQWDTVIDLYKPILHEALLNSGADITPLENMVHQFLDEDKLRQSPIDFAMVTVQFPTFKPVQLDKHQIPEGQIADYLLASAACHPAFKMRDIMGQKFLDGGFYDNLPINLALDLGAEEIIAVDLHAVGLKRPAKVACPITYIESYWGLGPTLMFDAELSKRNIRLGYLDTLKAFHRKDGHAYTFEPIAEQEVIALYNKLLLILYGYFYLAEDHHALYQKHFIAALKQLVKHRDSPDFEQLTPKNFILLAAEICAEFLLISPTVCYSLAEFNALIKKQFHQLLNGDACPPDKLHYDVNSIKEHQQHIITYYVDVMQTIKQSTPPHSLPMNLSEHLDELLAAAYLALLML